MPTLFAVMLGGRAQGCNTELHDTVFVVANKLVEAFPLLVNKWFGLTKRLHIDAYIELDVVDGYEVVVSTSKPEQQTKHLFFVNYGGYKPNYFGEIHEVAFFIAEEKQEALQKAQKKLGLTLLEPHCDDNILVDDVNVIDQVDQFYIHLKPTDKASVLSVHPSYIRLDVPTIIEQADKLKPQLALI